MATRLVSDAERPAVDGVGALGALLLAIATAFEGLDLAGVSIELSSTTSASGSTTSGAIGTSGNLLGKRLVLLRKFLGGHAEGFREASLHEVSQLEV